MSGPNASEDLRDETSDRAVFGNLVREAIDQLHDPTYLQKHPLRELLAGRAGERGAAVLQQALLDAIEQLRPGPATPSDSPGWRRYLYLRRRYVERVSLDHIRDELATGERQARRYNHEALEALTSLLWSRFGQGRIPEDLPEPSIEARGHGTTVAAELASMVRFVPPGPTPLAETLASAIETISRLLEDNRVALDVSLPGSLPPVAVPRVILRQLLLGLLVGCIEPYPGARLVLTAFPRSEILELRLAIRREQSSSGNAAGWREAKSAEAMPSQALETARQLIELQNGSLTVDAPSSSGIDILVTLPLSPRATVLVIDDNLDFRRLFQRFLEGSSYQAIFAEVNDDFSRLAREERPDIIILDIMMPTQDGWEVLQTLKKEPETRDIPVIVCSVTQLPTLARSLGADDYLAKPISQRDLLTLLGHCRSRQAAEATSRGSAEGRS